MRSIVLLVALCAACGKGNKGGGAESLEGGKATDIKVELTGTAVPNAKLEATIQDAKGQIVTPAAEIRLAIGEDGRCNSVATANYDPTSHHLKLEIPLGGGPDCNFADRKGPIPVELAVHPSGAYGFTTKTSIELAVTDDRTALLPALDAELDRLAKAVAAIGDAGALPPCKAADFAGAKGSLDAFDARGWTWLATPLFNHLDAYKKRHAAAPETLLHQLQAQPVVVVYVAGEHELPVRRSQDFKPGSFVGQAVALDRAAGKPRCAIAFTAHSSAKIDFTAKTTEHGVSSDDAAANLESDFEGAFAKAQSEAFAKAGVAELVPAPTKSP
jgi:hypothetical protein